METKKMKQKVINIARKYPLDSPSTRLSQSNLQKHNIFKSTPLQMFQLNDGNKPYECVGIKQLKEYITKKRNAYSSKKRGWCVTPNCSTKTYSAIKSSEQQDLLMTKADILSYYNETKKPKSSNSSECKQVSKSASTCFNSPMLEKLSSKQSSCQKQNKQKKVNKKQLWFTQSQQAYLEKVQQLKRNALRERRQNIQCSHWAKSLRNSADIFKVYLNIENNFQVIKLNGFKLVAESKMKKQMNWIESVKDSTLFEPIEPKNYSKIFESRTMRQNDEHNN